MSIFSKREKNTYITKYLQGLPNINVGDICKLSFDNENLIIQAIKVSGIIKSKVNVINTFKINNKKIISFDLINKSNIETKSKSVIGRGIAGGLIFGPVGAIIGGISGTKQDIKSNDEFFLNISYYGVNEDDLKVLIFKVGIYPNIARMFIQEYNNNFFVEKININENGEIIL